MHNLSMVSAAAEASKIAKYSNHMGMESTASQFVPFVVEATGRLGKKASEFIDRWSGITGPGQHPDERQAKARRFFLSRVSVIVAKYNARMIQFYRESSRLVHYDHDVI